MVDASADETAPDCDCEMLALRASVLILPLMREKKDSRSRDDPDARAAGASPTRYFEAIDLTRCACADVGSGSLILGFLFVES